MFSLSQEERRVVLFLISIALLGLGVNCFLKLNSASGISGIVPFNASKIDINKASLRDLLQCNCISSKLAEKIIEYRDTNGSFRKLEDLKEVKGIGDYRYEKLKEIFFIE